MDLTLPYACLQADYVQAYTDVDQSLHDFEKVWLSIYCQNAPNASIHSKLLLSRSKGKDVEVELVPAEEGSASIEVQVADSNGMDLKIASTSALIDNGFSAKRTHTSISFESLTMRVPKRAIGPVVKGPFGVTAFDMASGRYVAGGSDGQIYIGSIDNESTMYQLDKDDREESCESVKNLAQIRMRRRESDSVTQSKTKLQGHVGDIRSAKFFPSGQVVFTTSSDCTARVYGLDGSNPRTLTGHRQGVTNSYIIDRGKKVLTCSSDGTTRLWDIGQGVQEKNFSSYKYSSVNVTTMGKSTVPIEDHSNKIILTGLSNGYLQGHDITSGKSLFHIPPITFPSGQRVNATDDWKQSKSGSIEALDWSVKNHTVLIGCSNGITVCHDDRMFSNQDELELHHSAVASWCRNGASINNINLLEHGKEAIISTSDGTPYRVDLNSTPKVIEEYNGWDVDNVQNSSIDDRGRLWLAGAQGMIRMYNSSLN